MKNFLNLPSTFFENKNTLVIANELSSACMNTLNDDNSTTKIMDGQNFSKKLLSFPKLSKLDEDSKNINFLEEETPQRRTKLDLTIKIPNKISKNNRIKK